jgi:hypothetical protein
MAAEEGSLPLAGRAAREVITFSLPARLSPYAILETEVRQMEGSVSPPPTPETAADYEAAIEGCLVEIRRLNEQMRNDRDEIERLKTETLALKAENQRLKTETRASLPDWGRKCDACGSNSSSRAASLT